MNDKINDGGPAFPYTWVRSDEPATPMQGMTLRDYFAAKAMQALLGSQDMAANTVRAAKDNGREDTELFMAEAAYEIADAMLKAREHGS